MSMELLMQYVMYMLAGIGVLAFFCKRSSTSGERNAWIE